MKKDHVKISWKEKRNLAVHFATSLVDTMVKDYQEPTRAGTRKGDPIGFSLRKKRAAWLMLVYNPPTGLGLIEISKIAGVSPGVLRLWRTEAAFKKEVREACRYFMVGVSDVINTEIIQEEIRTLKVARREDGPNVLRLLERGGKTVFKVLKSERGTPLIETFIRSEAPGKQIEVVEIDNSHERLKNPSCESMGISQKQMKEFFLKTLPFLNPLVAKPLIQLIAKNIESTIPGYTGLGLLLMKVAEVKDEKRLRQWNASPEIKALTRALIQSLIDFISDPDARKAYGQERVQEAIKALKTLIFKELEL